MKWNILVNSEIFCYLLNGEFDPSNVELQNVQRRVRNNKVIYNDNIIDHWESYISKEKPELMIYFHNFIPKLMSLPENFSLKEDSQNPENKELSVLERAALDLNDSIVVDDFKLNNFKKYKSIKYCKPEDFKSSFSNCIKINEITSFNNGGVYIKNLFSLIELPLVIEVSNNQSATELASFIGRFIAKTKNITIQDAYFETNHLNFEKYIVPFIDEGTSIFIKSKTFKNNSLKRSLEQKFNLKFSFDSDIHRGFIQTDNYDIELGYRLAIFGENDKTKKENINIREK